MRTPIYLFASLLLAGMPLPTSAQKPNAPKAPKTAPVGAKAPADTKTPTDTKTPAPAAPKPSPEGKPSEAAHSAADVAARVQKFYQATSDLHAKFDQELTVSLGGKKKASGEVWLKKPGRMRWEYQKPEKKLMVADGTTLWVYEPEDEQAFRQSLSASSLPSSVSFLFGNGKLSDEFTITEERPPEGAGEPGDVVLKLVPIKPTAQYRYLYFVVDPKTSMVKETLLIDQQGGSNRMRFRDVETNKGLSNAKFQFTPPQGTKVIRP